MLVTTNMLKEKAQDEKRAGAVMHMKRDMRNKHMQAIKNQEASQVNSILLDI